MKKITKSELENLQTLNTEFSKTRLSIGDLELTKALRLIRLTLLKNSLVRLKKKLITKYGEDSVINMQTGELTKKK
jgi:hypothetical protein